MSQHDTQDRTNQADAREPERDDSGDGQVSEVGRIDEHAEAPIMPDQAVAGYPDSESGSPDEGPAGPNSKPDPDDEAR